MFDYTLTDSWRRNALKKMINDAGVDFVRNYPELDKEIKRIIGATLAGMMIQHGEPKHKDIAAYMQDDDVQFVSVFAKIKDTLVSWRYDENGPSCSITDTDNDVDKIFDKLNKLDEAVEEEEEESDLDEILMIPAAKAGCMTPNGIVTDPRELVDKIISNPPATIVFWKNGDKTVVRCSKDDAYDVEKGVAVAFLKYMFGNTGRFNEMFHEFKEGTGTVWQSE